MSSLVRPVGPQDPRTYWLRRAVVVAVVVLVGVLLLWLIRPSGDRTVSTVPSTSSEPSTTTSTTQPAQTPSESAAPQESTTPGASRGSTESPSPSDTSEPSASPTPQAPASAGESGSPAASPTSGAPTPSPTALVACKPSDLRVTLTGPGTVSAGKVVTFELSVINGAGAACVIDVNADNFELKVYSGTDRIWSTDHCADWVPRLGGELEPEGSLAWAMDWPAKRSAAKCTIRDLTLQPGTYVATAQIEGAQPVQHVMRLR